MPGCRQPLICAMRPSIHGRWLRIKHLSILREQRESRSKHGKRDSLRDRAIARPDCERNGDFSPNIKRPCVNLLPLHDTHQFTPASVGSSVGGPAASSQTCFQICGRAVWYRGDGFFAIWHVGTHHVFVPADKKSSDLICQYFDCANADRQPALLANFTVCPTKPYRRGEAQPS